MALFDVVCSKGIGVVAPTDTDTELLCALHTCFWMSFKLNSTNGHVFSSAQFGRIVGCECLREPRRSPLIGNLTPHHVFVIAVSIAACHLERLEMTICKGMDWRLNPPIPSSYVELVDPLLEEVLGNGGLAPLRKEIRALAYDLIDASNSNDGLNVAAPVGEEGRARSTSTGGGNERGWGGNPPGYDQFRADPAFCSMLMDTSRACIGASADVPGGVFVRGLLNSKLLRGAAE